MEKKKRFTTLLTFLLLIIILITPLSNKKIKDNNKINPDFTFEKTGIKSSEISGRIHIANNWSDARDAGICTGSGTYSDPYLIEDLVIDGGGSGSGILIYGSTNIIFRIENCTIYNCDTGIKLYNTNNGTIYRNDCSYNINGITIECDTKFTQYMYLYLNKNNTIIENIANFNSENGIFLNGVYCNHTKVIGNFANNNDDYGIYIEGRFTTVKDNTANNNRAGILLSGFGNYSSISGNILWNNEDSGIHIYGMEYILTNNNLKGSGIIVYPSHNIQIDTTNLVNDKRFYYLSNQHNLKSSNFYNAGQIFLVNCSNIELSNFDLSLSTIGISLYYCNKVRISGINSSYNALGIDLFETNHSTILNCYINNNHEGIHLSGSDHNTISRNSVNKNYWEGIYLADSINNSIIENEIHENLWGIRNWLYCHNNRLRGNKISDNLIGIEVRASDNCFISENIVNDNSFGIDIIGNYLDISQNICYNNKEYGLSIIGNFNKITDNFIRNNSKYGLFLQNAINNEIYNNIIKDNNQTGVYIEGLSCQNNSFYLNFFIGNSNHVFDNGTNNKWNSTNIGNYWDNYTGNDINGDGIGDIPYNVSISPLIQDFLPIIDNDIPYVIIHSPQTNETFGKKPPSLIISVEEKYLYLIWYTLDDGLHNYTFISNGIISQEAWEMVKEGPVVLKIYAMDKTGKIGYVEVTIIKKIPKKEVIPGYNLWTLLFLTLLISIAFAHKTKRLLKD